MVIMLWKRCVKIPGVIHRVRTVLSDTTVVDNEGSACMWHVPCSDICSSCWWKQAVWSGQCLCVSFCVILYSFSESSTLLALTTRHWKLFFDFRVALRCWSSGSAPTGNLLVLGRWSRAVRFVLLWSPWGFAAYRIPWDICYIMIAFSSIHTWNLLVILRFII